MSLELNLGLSFSLSPFSEKPKKVVSHSGEVAAIDVRSARRSSGRPSRRGGISRRAVADLFSSPFRGY